MQTAYTHHNLAFKGDEQHKVNEENVIPSIEKVLPQFSPRLRSSSQLNPDKYYDWYKVIEQMQAAYTCHSLAFKSDEQCKVNEENVVPIIEKVLLRSSSKLQSSSQLNPDIHKKVSLGFRLSRGLRTLVSLSAEGAPYR